MNPLDKWRIYLNCRERGEPIPEDVLEYLDSVGKQLVRRGWGSIPEKNEQIALEALGLRVRRGQRSAFTQDFLNRRDRMIRHWWNAYRAGNLDQALAANISNLFGKPDNRKFKDERDFFQWAATLNEVEMDTIEKIVRES